MSRRQPHEPQEAATWTTGAMDHRRQAHGPPEASHGPQEAAPWTTMGAPCTTGGSPMVP